MTVHNSRDVIRIVFIYFVEFLRRQHSPRLDERDFVYLLHRFRNLRFYTILSPVAYNYHSSYVVRLLGLRHLYQAALWLFVQAAIYRVLRRHLVVILIHRLRNAAYVLATSVV